MTVCAAKLTGATLAALTLGYLCVRSLGNSSVFRWMIPWPKLAGVKWRTPCSLSARPHALCLPLACSLSQSRCSPLPTPLALPPLLTFNAAPLANPSWASPRLPPLHLLDLSLYLHEPLERHILISATGDFTRACRAWGSRGRGTPPHHALPLPPVRHCASLLMLW